MTLKEVCLDFIDILTLLSQSKGFPQESSDILQPLEMINDVVLYLDLTIYYQLIVNPTDLIVFKALNDFLSAFSLIYILLRLIF